MTCHYTNICLNISSLQGLFHSIFPIRSESRTRKPLCIAHAIVSVPFQLLAHWAVSVETHVHTQPHMWIFTLKWFTLNIFWSILKYMIKGSLSINSIFFLLVEDSFKTTWHYRVLPSSITTWAHEVQTNPEIQHDLHMMSSDIMKWVKRAHL